MFSKDYLIRQVQQFVQALAVALLHKRAGQHDLAQSIIHNTLMDELGRPLDDVRGLPSDQLLALVSRSDGLSTDLALAIADLLREDESLEGRRRALWLYEAALEAGGTLPLDIHDRIAHLRTETEA